MGFVSVIVGIWIKSKNFYISRMRFLRCKPLEAARSRSWSFDADEPLMIPFVVASNFQPNANRVKVARSSSLIKPTLIAQQVHTQPLSSSDTTILCSCPNNDIHCL